LLKPYNFLTYKPFIYALNVSDEELLHADKIVKEYEEKLGKPVVVVSAKIESELLEFNNEEKKEFLEDMFGEAKVPTLDDLIKLAFDTVGLMYYFTTGEKETRAWTVKKGSTAPQAA
jgi:ribosome-binding ATPase